MAWFRRVLTVLAGVTLAVSITSAAQAAPAPTPVDQPTECSADFFQGDRRLGPEQLPEAGDVGLELVGYRRTGSLPVSQFLDTYYDPSANSGQGGWRYPPANGYVIEPDGQPEEYTSQLIAGQHIDRYGSEYGSFLSPPGIAVRHQVDSAAKLGR